MQQISDLHFDGDRKTAIPLLKSDFNDLLAGEIKSRWLKLEESQARKQVGESLTYVDSASLMIEGGCRNGTGHQSWYGEDDKHQDD